MASTLSIIHGQRTVPVSENEGYHATVKSEKNSLIEEDSLDAIVRDNFENVGGLTRTQTLHSLSASSTSSFSENGCPLQERGTNLYEDFSTFGMELRRESQNTPDIPLFHKGMRRVMEPHLRKARIAREKARSPNGLQVEGHISIASHVGVPYIGLRTERPFLYDVDTHPMHSILAETLGVHDLSKLHKEPELKDFMEPLRSRSGRRKFQESYDSFVTSFCIPLVHSIAMSKNIFHSTSPDSSISYRYQAFPNIRVIKPGDISTGPQCDTINGHSIGSLHFHVPLTPSVGTNALYTESYPGREDWHPLVAKSVGLGFLFDGARCLYFNMENMTNETSVSLDFVITFYGEKQQDYVDGHCLCNKSALEDRFSVTEGYYDEAVIDMNHRNPTFQIVAKKNGNHLLDPVGFPFV